MLNVLTLAYWLLVLRSRDAVNTANNMFERKSRRIKGTQHEESLYSRANMATTTLLQAYRPRPRDPDLETMTSRPRPPDHDLQYTKARFSVRSIIKDISKEGIILHKAPDKSHI